MKIILISMLQTILKLLMTGHDSPQAGIMIPIPQYPLYTAILAEFNAVPVSTTDSMFILISYIPHKKVVERIQKIRELGIDSKNNL